MMGSMMRRGMLGDGSTLSLDFTTGVLDPLLTFTRSTSGTYIGADGLVKTATANTPRFDYDPTAIGTPRGLLIESSANNVLQYSVAVDQSPWFVAGGVTRTTLTGGIGPDGVNNSGSKLSAVNISSSSSLYYNGVAFTSGTTYTYSVWAKADGANWIWISLHLGGAQHGAFFDLSGNGALGNTTGTVVSGSNTITKYPNGWFRLTVAHTAASTSAYFPVLLPCTSNGTGYASIAGQSPNGVLVYGAQLESGSGASSYIPTGASTGSRAADSCVMTGTNFSSWFNATEGTFLAHARRIRTSDVGRIASANDNTASESIDIGASTTGQFIVTDGGSALATITPGTVTANTAFKIAGAFKLNDVQAALGGTLGTADSSVTVPTVNQLMIGQQAGASPVYLNGTVAMLKFWATRLPNDQLQALTT